IIMSRSPEEARNWIKKNVDNHMNWEVMQDALRLSRQDLILYLQDNPHLFPVYLRIHYQDVQNLIQSRLARLSGKAYTDKDSVNEWIKHLTNEGFDVLFDVNDKGAVKRFILAWVSQWQLPILQRQDEVCIDSTHKTCVSFIDNRDCYLFTIICKNSDTKKGCPVGFMITNSE
ncbi:hypothetical protein BDC45DRAFT_423468, partial [Circinella umbellata]